MCLAQNDLSYVFHDSVATYWPRKCTLFHLMMSGWMSTFPNVRQIDFQHFWRLILIPEYVVLNAFRLSKFSFSFD